MQPVADLSLDGSSVNAKTFHAES